MNTGDRKTYVASNSDTATYCDLVLFYVSGIQSHCSAHKVVVNIRDTTYEALEHLKSNSSLTAIISKNC